MSLFPVKSNGSFLADAFSDFTSLLFPEYCLGCSSGLIKGEDILCSRCLLNLPRTGYFQPTDNPIKDKFLGRLPLKSALTFLRFRKKGIGQHLLHQLKYNNHPEIGIRLGKLFGKEILENEIDSEFDLIVPLPLHASRQKKRGYNQSAKFAEGLSEILGIPFKEACARLLNTNTQTRKTKSERWANVHHAFEVVNKTIIQDKKILLVDDVITTGATIEACGLQLLKAGCKELSIACIAEAQ